MLRSSRLRRFTWATGFMLAGTFGVLGIVVLINYYSDALEDSRAEVESQIAFERRKPPQEKPVQKPKPRPKPRRSQRSAPAPLTGLDTSLSGIDMGLPGFSADHLGALEGDLLGGAEGMVMTDDTVDHPPRATYQAAVTYPPRARANGVEGYVVFSLLIGLTGEIEQVRIVESYPQGVFDEAAMAGINQWRFEPALYQGKAVRSWARQRVRFDLG
ncbi:energy transducer TonB [Elongatibacter sediminis]|uniref:Protein TonB n=1 Tax=Elongatibacter sediminis TaxID=3119006 RepID=A0AAW9RLL2_9GAMM